MEHEYLIEISWQTKKVVAVSGKDVRAARIAAKEMVSSSEENIVPYSLVVNEDTMRHVELNEVHTVVITKNIPFKNRTLYSGERHVVKGKTSKFYILEEEEEVVHVPLECAYPVI